MTLDEEIVPGSPVICSDEIIFGYVEGMESPYLLTTPMEDGQRHYIPLDLIERVDDGVYLTVSSEELSQKL